MLNEIIFGAEARAELAKGVEVLARAVKTTLGPKGSNVLIQNDYGPPKVTKDGVTVARGVQLKGRAQNQGAQMVIQASLRTAEDAGDGTTTSTVLAESIFLGALKYLVGNADPISLKRGIDAAAAKVLEALPGMARPAADISEIGRVGTISANGDEEIGNLIAEALERVGLEGVIAVEESKGMDTTIAFSDGMEIDRGYLSPHFVTDHERAVVEMENAWVFVTDRRIISLRDILPLLEQVAKSSRPLLIIAEDVEGEALNTLVVNKLRGSLHVCAIKAPGYGESRSEGLADIAALTGATLVSEQVGLQLSSASLHHLGQAERIRINRNFTTLLGGNGDPDLLKQRTASLHAQYQAEQNPHARDVLQARIAQLSGGIAVIRIGAATETEVREKRDRVEDALAATRAATEEGVVPGGGVALIRLSAVLDEMSFGDDRDLGVKCLRDALRGPLSQIVTNAGGNPGVVINEILQHEGSYGYNALTGEFGDLMDMGVIDPAKVVRVALQNAVSAATMLLSTDCVMTDDGVIPDAVQLG